MVQNSCNHLNSCYSEFWRGWEGGGSDSHCLFWICHCRECLRKANSRNFAPQHRNAMMMHYERRRIPQGRHRKGIGNCPAYLWAFCFLLKRQLIQLRFWGCNLTFGKVYSPHLTFVKVNNGEHVRNTSLSFSSFNDTRELCPLTANECWSWTGASFIATSAVPFSLCLDQNKHRLHACL